MKIKTREGKENTKRKLFPRKYCLITTWIPLMGMSISGPLVIMFEEAFTYMIECHMTCGSVLGSQGNLDDDDDD